MKSYYESFLKKYAKEFSSYTDKSSRNYISPLNEYRTLSGKGIHMVDNYKIYRDALILKTQMSVLGKKTSYEKAQDIVMSCYMSEIGNTKANIKSFYSNYIDKLAKELSVHANGETKENPSEEEQKEILQKLHSNISREFDRPNDVLTGSLDDIKSQVLEEYTNYMFEVLTKKSNLFNTDCMNNLPFQILKTGYKESNPHKTFKFNFEELIGTTYQKDIESWCEKKGNNICEVLFLKGAWHEAIHCSGTPDEFKTECFAYLKMLQTFKEPALLETGFFGRANAALDRMEATRHEVHDKGMLEKGTANTNWTYQMIPLLNHLRKCAPQWVRDESFLNKSNNELMDMVNEMSKNSSLRYPAEAELEFRESLNVEYDQLIDTLKKADEHSILGTILKEAMAFYNSYRDPNNQYKSIEDFIEDKRRIFEEEHSEIQERENGYTPQSSNKKEDFKLSDEDLLTYQNMYEDLKQKMPNASEDKIKIEFCRKIIDRNFSEKAKIEAAYNENGSLFFDEERCKKDSERIRNLIDHCQNADEIVLQITHSQERQRSESKAKIPPCPLVLLQKENPHL